MSEKELPFFRKDRISTGIRALDLMLEGGYKHPATIMLTAPSGPEKQCFASHFVNRGMEQRDTIIYITTDNSPKDIEKTAAGWDLHFKGPGQLYYINCYSKGKTTKMNNVYDVSGPGALNEISLYISEILRQNRGGRIRLVFHTFSTFALYNQQGSLFKFLQSVEERVKRANGTTLLLVEEGMHEKKFVTTLRHSTDEEYLLESKGKKMEMTGKRLPIPVPVKVGSLGVEVE
ncbi:MAG: RAD55 family ATPase [Candidatus Micrarchaeia archaeon]